MSALTADRNPQLPFFWRPLFCLYRAENGPVNRRWKWSQLGQKKMNQARESWFLRPSGNIRRCTVLLS